MADRYTIPRFKRNDNSYDNLYFKMKSIDIQLRASGWSASIPYTQTVSVANVTDAFESIIGLKLTSTDPAQVKLLNKNFGFLDRAVTNNGSITFYCYNKKPTIDFTVTAKGF